MRQKLSQDINSIWSHRFSFPEKAEYAGFIFSGEYLFLAAKYIIGCAAFGVGLAETALQLHENLGGELETIKGHPNIVYITKRLNSLLAEEHAIVAYRVYASEGDQETANTHLVKCFEYDPRNYDGHLLKAIIEFLYEHNPTRALQTINLAASFSGRNGTWRYSKGFLLMYLEKFDRALSVYHEIVRNSFEGEEGILSQVYDFNAQLIQREPEKIQSYFILGFLKYKKEQNYPEALEYFQSFLDGAQSEDKFRSLINVAHSYKKQLESVMQLD